MSNPELIYNNAVGHSHLSAVQAVYSAGFADGQETVCSGAGAPKQDSLELYTLVESLKTDVEGLTNSNELLKVENEQLQSELGELKDKHD